jgi:transcriptional regulator with XRE-family HTH domain
MSEREAFGPNLRRIRMQRGVSVDDIVSKTNVPAALWEGLERNDLSRWPAGIYARANIRSYANAIGVDPESTVDQFCRCFPQGDRRAEGLIRGQAEIVGHADLQWQDATPPQAGDGDRRGAATRPHRPRRSRPAPVAAFSQMFGRLRALLRA